MLEQKAKEESTQRQNHQKEIMIVIINILIV